MWWLRNWDLIHCLPGGGFPWILFRCLSGKNLLVFVTRCAIIHQARPLVETSWNMMAHVQKQEFVFRRNGRVHLYRRGHQFSRLLAAKVCASAVVMLDTPCSEVVWRVLATQSIDQFPLHFPSRASRCAITFQLEFNIFCYVVYLSFGSCQNVTLYIRFWSYFIAYTYIYIYIYTFTWKFLEQLLLIFKYHFFLWQLGSWRRRYENPPKRRDTTHSTRTRNI